MYVCGWNGRRGTAPQCNAVGDNTINLSEQGLGSQLPQEAIDAIARAGDRTAAESAHSSLQ